MFSSRIKTAAVMLAASVGLAGCAYGPYGGVSVGGGYGNYGYGSYGYDPYYAGYGYGYGDPYFGGYYGWNNGYYYPGTGWYVYDPHRNRHPMTDSQRNFWRTQLEKYRQQHGTTAQVRENWEGFSRQRVASSPSTVATGTARADQQSIRQIREVRRQAVAEQQQARSEARAARMEARQEMVRERTQERRRGKPDE